MYGVKSIGLRTIKKPLLYAVLLLASFVMVLPFAWMLSASLKLETEVFAFPIQWIPSTFKWENYVEVWTSVPFALYYWNSIKVALAVTVIQVITSALAAYAFAKIRFPERDRLFLVYLIALMIPFQVVMIPQFFIVKSLGLIDSHLSLILIYSFTPFGVFLFRQFFLSIPEDLSESARIDGCSEFGIFSKIILPLSKPAIASLVIFAFMFAWNDFLGPLIYLNSDIMKTLQLGMRDFTTQYRTEYALIMAASVSAIVPAVLVYLLAQDYFIAGLSAGAVKG